MIKWILFIGLISVNFRLTPANAGERGDAVGAVLEVLGKLVSVLVNDKDNCCPTVWKNPQTDATICIDGTSGTTGCGVGKCNWNGCQCAGGCKSVKSGVSIAHIRQTTIMYRYTDMVYATDKCVDLDWWNDRISGWIPIYGCIKVFEDKGCTGRSNCMCVGSSHFHLSDIQWDDKISSYQKC